MASINVQFTSGSRKANEYYYRVGTLLNDGVVENIKCLELHSPHAIGAEDSLYFSDLTVSILFMISKEEASWLETEPEKLDAFVLELVEKLPSDRLMSGQYLGLADNNRMSFKPEGKCDTMDDHRIQYAYHNLPYSLEDWKKLEKVWVMTNARVVGNFPGVDMNEAVNVFLDEEQGKAETERFGEDFKIREMSGEDFVKELDRFLHMGIPKIAIRKKSVSRVIEIKKLFGTEEVFSGATLQLNMIRFLQTIRSVHRNEDNYKKTATLWWSQICNELLNTTFVVPVYYDGEDMKKKVEDSEVHLFPKTGLDAIPEKGQLTLVKGKEEKVLYGSQGLSPAKKSDSRLMHIRTSYNPALKQEWLAIFTDVKEFDKVWKGSAHIGFASFMDFATNYEPAQGIVINPASECFFLDKATIEALVNLKRK
ncbi:MAG: SseB family protein [Firmicutes bacterium]|nr:SseB family protein [Bacillota bacterium]